MKNRAEINYSIGLAWSTYSFIFVINEFAKLDQF